MKDLISDKAHIEYILGSIEYIYEWTTNHTIDSLEKDLKTLDATFSRLYHIGYATSLISENLKNKYPEFDWSFIQFFKVVDFYGFTEFWEILHGYMDKDGMQYKSLKDIFIELEDIYLQEFQKKEKDHTHEKLPWTRDYKYPVITKNSIWTIKNK